MDIDADWDEWANAAVHAAPGAHGDAMEIMTVSGAGGGACDGESTAAPSPRRHSDPIGGASEHSLGAADSSPAWALLAASLAEAAQHRPAAPKPYRRAKDPRAARGGDAQRQRPRPRAWSLDEGGAARAVGGSGSQKRGRQQQQQQQQQRGQQHLQQQLQQHLQQPRPPPAEEQRKSQKRPSPSLTPNPTPCPGTPGDASLVASPEPAPRSCPSRVVAPRPQRLPPGLALPMALHDARGPEPVPYYPEQYYFPLPALAMAAPPALKSAPKLEEPSLSLVQRPLGAQECAQEYGKESKRKCLSVPSGLYMQASAQASAQASSLSPHGWR